MRWNRETLTATLVLYFARTTVCGQNRSTEGLVSLTSTEYLEILSHWTGVTRGLAIVVPRPVMKIARTTENLMVKNREDESVFRNSRCVV